MLNENNETLFELSMSQMSEKKISKHMLRIEKPTVFLTVPDTNIKVWDHIHNAGLFLSNCKGIVTPNKMFKIGNKTFNGKEHHIDLKKHLQVKQNTGKKLNITSTLTGLKNVDPNKSKDYYFYDLSIITKAFKFLANKNNTKISSLRLFESIQKEYNNIKKRNTTVNVELLFLINDLNGHIYNTIINARKYLPADMFQNMAIYDNFGIVSNTKNTIIPIFYKDKFDNSISWVNVRKLSNYLDSETTAKNIESESAIESDGKNTNKHEEIPELTKNDNTFEQIIDKLKTSKLVTDVSDDGESIEVKIDNKKLSTILKKYKITDPDIVANVRAALNGYIAEKGDKLNETEAETIVFHAIHYSIYGTDEIQPEFIKNPDKLLKKLEGSRAHKTPLIFDTNTQKNVINPTDIIDINYTTGSWRQKQEFEKSIHENVKKLFSTLEDTGDYPIKVKNIEHNIVDDDSSRLIRYKVTLENTSGGKKEPYDVYLNVPSTVNDRYFKLNGVTYITPAQQFLKPVTKTDKDNVRVLTNYSIVRLQLENIKFMPTQIKEIINYIQIKYPNLIKDYKENEYVQFSDKSVMYINNEEKIYESQLSTIKLDRETQKLVDNEGNQINNGKYEYQYGILIEKIQSINKDDTLAKSKKSIPYFSLYLGGFKIPFIIYLWQQKGLLSALNDFGIDYEITEDVSTAKHVINHKGKYLALHPETKREELFCNGLLVFKVNKDVEKLDDPEEIYESIDKQLGQGALYNMGQMSENMIDPITKELLEFEGLPVNLNNLLTTHCVDKLLNKDIDDMSDLKIYRARISELFLNIMYSQLKMSHNEYRKKIRTMDDKDAKLNLYSDFILETIYNQVGVLNYTEAVNPIDEIFLASKTFKTGPGGVPGKNSFKKEHRNIHESHIGNMAANATSESSNVGLDASHTLTPAILNSYGGYGKKNVNGMSGWNALAINEALTPFINEIDSDRAVMGTVH